MFRGLYFIILIINIRASLCVTEALYEAGQQVWKLYTIIDNRELTISHNAKGSEQPNDHPMIREMKRQVDRIHEQLNQLEKIIGYKRILYALRPWQLSAILIWKIDTFQLFIENIDEYYKNFDHCRNESHCSHTVLEMIMKDAFPNIEGDIGIIREIATNEKKTQSNKEDLVAALVGFARARCAELCGTPQIFSNFLIQLLRIIIVAELKVNTMLAYDNIYGYVKNEDKQGWRRINLLAREKLERQFAAYMNVFSWNMPVLDVVYNRACDPPGGNWIRDESFYELERNFQPVVFGYNLYACKFQSCKHLPYSNIDQCELSPYGEIVGSSFKYSIVGECDYLGHMKICLLENGPYRYQYINSEAVGFLGRNDSCSIGDEVESSLMGPPPYLTCVCNVYSSQNKISLLMIESDVNFNQVITGLRFFRKDEVLYIQPREGTLKPNGYIDESSQTWIPIPENINSSLIEPIRNNSVFFLDDLTLSKIYVLTGIKFNKATRGDVSGFAIEIFGTIFDYRTGMLFTADFKPSWKGSNEKSGKRLSFTPVSSIFTTLTHIVTPSDTKYVLLEPSRLKEDIGQSTLPLFDGVPITLEVPSALGGVGIFHKGVEGYAGLISLRVYGIQYGELFSDFKTSHIINNRVSFNASLH